MINFPYTNFHRLNLDWILQTVEKLVEDVKKIPETITAIVDSRGYVTREEASAAAPVQSVNGETGAVTLTAADVGAKPASYEAPVQSVNGETGAVNLTAADVGALPDDYTPPQEVFWATYGVTTNAEIEQALDNGMLPCVYGPTREYYCVFSRRQSATTHYFGGTYTTSTGNKYIVGMRCNNGTWTQTSSVVAPTASPAFTGTPTAPTAETGTNSTQLATTAFVQQEFSSTDYQEIIDTTSFTWGDVAFRFHKWGKLVILSVKLGTTNGSISADTDLLPFTSFPSGYAPNNSDPFDYTGFIGRGGGGTAGFGTLRLTATALKYSPYTTAVQGNNYQGSIAYLTA